MAADDDGQAGRTGLPGDPVTIIVDGANVVGSRPDGWWRDRAGAAVRLHDSLAGLAARGTAGLPAGLLATGDIQGDASGHEGAAVGGAGGEATGLAGVVPVDVVLVLEGAAKAAGARIAAQTRSGEDGGQAPGTVRVVSAPGSGDDEIVRLARTLPGRRIVVTADRELRHRSMGAGAEVAGPSWLRGLL